MINKKTPVSGKFVLKNKRLRASHNPQEVGAGSRLITELTAEFYDINLKKYAKGYLLDLGCGNIPLFIAYNDLITNLLCVDWKNPFSEEYVDVYADLNEKLPFPENTFDTIILSDVLEHIRNPELLWFEMYRILKNEGILILNVPFFYWLHEIPNDFFRYTEFALKHFAQKSGFEIIELKALGGVPEIMTDIFSKNIVRLPVLGKIFALFLQKFNLLFLKTKFGKKISQKTSKKFPYSYGMIVKKTTNI